ncbi:type II toxin-antitoxin system RelE/ParE family toxin [Brucella pseudogrignonensis]|uniref:mRNA interferase RelE/StbE n=1 Tax=Brucella pseudogrignonensis TaxID=419475 RepID=A0ABU1ME93_9HYPH|nr:type II toxin-antitoxin system RelE/ParE family toxin [Brucella pseudogrignonensis]MDR6434378.1 mRNA interferase RelE/StbE [Brucella pseudogrignonensis]
MTFELEIIPSARKEWDKLGSSIKEQFKKKLRERLISPRMPSAVLHGMKDHYKIKLRQLGYRLVYRVDDERVTVLVIAVGKRDKGDVYKVAKERAQ